MQAENKSRSDKTPKAAGMVEFYIMEFELQKPDTVVKRTELAREQVLLVPASKQELGSERRAKDRVEARATMYSTEQVERDHANELLQSFLVEVFVSLA